MLSLDIKKKIYIQYSQRNSTKNVFLSKKKTLKTKSVLYYQTQLQIISPKRRNA